MSDADAPDDQVTFRFPFARPERLAGLLFGITPHTARVTITGDRLAARFGPWHVVTPLGNVAGAEITGPYAWPKIIGPAHLSLKDRGLTFASTDRQGVCIRFRTPVTGIDALGLIRHPSLTVPVADAPTLVELLRHASDAGRATPITVDKVQENVADDLHGLSARELRERARSLGITGVSSMKKDELVDALSHHSR